MALSSLFFDIPLSRPPRIVEADAVSQHSRRYEFYRLEKVYYRVDRLWCLNLFLGDGELRVNNVAMPIHTGYAGITCPNVDLEYRYDGPAILSWVHFVPDPDAQAVPIAAMTDMGDIFENFRAQVTEIATHHSVCPQRAESILWALLWRLASMPQSSAGASQLHPVVGRVVEWINLHLHESFSVEDLAQRAGVSQNHLNRLFRAALNVTVADYIRMRRVRRAEHLLVYSNLPLKVIAANTGLGDPQHFCHVIRKITGTNPRDIRRRSESKMM